MSDTRILLGQKGRVVIPADVRRRHGWSAGQTLVLVDSDDGAILISQEALRELVRRRLEGPSLVDELLSERKAAAAEDVAG